MSDLNNVEAELQRIEQEFASGRMNAFGPAAAQDAFLRELKRVAEIETQVFYRMCSILKSSKEEEHAMLTGMYASAKPPPSQRPGGVDVTGSVTAHDYATGATTAGDATSSQPATRARDVPAPPASATDGVPAEPRDGPRPDAPRDAESRMNSTAGHNRTGEPLASATATGAAPHIRMSDWSNDTGFADKAFEDVAGHFAMLEGEFASLEDNLRQLSKHVVQLNEMSEQVNSMSCVAPTTFTSNTDGAFRD